MQIRRARDGGQSWIDDNELGTIVPRLPKPVRECGKRLTNVGAADHDNLSVLEVGVIIRAPVKSEGLLVSCAGTDHAEPAVVVEVSRLEGYSGELADQIALFVCQRNIRKHGKGVGAMGALDAPDFGDRSIERVLPTRALEAGTFD